MIVGGGTAGGHRDQQAGGEEGERGERRDDDPLPGPIYSGIDARWKFGPGGDPGAGGGKGVAQAHRGLDADHRLLRLFKAAAGDGPGNAAEQKHGAGSGQAEDPELGIGSFPADQQQDAGTDQADGHERGREGLDPPGKVDLASHGGGLAGPGVAKLVRGSFHDPMESIASPGDVAMGKFGEFGGWRAFEAVGWCEGRASCRGAGDLIDVVDLIDTPALLLTACEVAGARLG